MCIFCSIADGSIPAHKIYEDDHIVAFLDIAQVTKGHTLVVPKRHYEHFLACDNELLSYLMLKAQIIGNHIMNKTGAKGMHILSNINETAGQSVAHFHVHLIPRYDAQDACQIHFAQSEPQDLASLAKQLAV